MPFRNGRIKFVGVRCLYAILFSFGTIICVYAGYLAVNPIKPKVTIGWLWSEAYHKYGYLACSIENGSQMSNVVKEPKEYDESIIDNITVPKEQEKMN